MNSGVAGNKVPLHNCGCEKSQLGDWCILSTSPHELQTHFELNLKAGRHCKAYKNEAEDTRRTQYQENTLLPPVVEATRRAGKGA
jgi:hypothetical protein